VSAQLHGVGSIVAFYPDSTGPASGTVLVVVKRDMWVVHTELRRAVLVGGTYVIDPDGADDHG
jgi:hypothetical protein